MCFIPLSYSFTSPRLNSTWECGWAVSFWPKVIPSNPKETPVKAKIRGSDPNKRSTKNYPPLCGLDIRIRCFTKKGGGGLSWNWDETELLRVLSSPFRSTCVESVPDKLRVSRTCSGRLLRSGGRGRRFKSSHLDHYIKVLRSTLSRKVGVWDRIYAFLLASF